MKEFGKQADEKELVSNRLKVHKYYSLMLDSRLNLKDNEQKSFMFKGKKR